MIAIEMQAVIKNMKGTESLICAKTVGVLTAVVKTVAGNCCKRYKVNNTKNLKIMLKWLLFWDLEFIVVYLNKAH